MGWRCLGPADVSGRGNAGDDGHSGRGDEYVWEAAVATGDTVSGGASFAGFNQLITFNPLNSIITSASFVTSGSFNPVLAPTDLTFDADSVSLEVGGTGWFAGSSVTINLTTDAGPTIPEPGTIVLFGAGLLGLGVMRRRAAAKG